MSQKGAWVQAGVRDKKNYNMAKTTNKPHLTNFIKQNYIWILMIIIMSCIHLLYMYLIGARKQDVVYAAVLDAILLLITVLLAI